MANQARHLRPAIRLALGLWLLLAGLGLPSRQPPSVQAALQTGGTFTVTSADDTNLNDGVLTLREALLVAKGGTTPAGLHRVASAGEQAALGGCMFVLGTIVNGCGPGVTDTIVFASALGFLPIITLTASLPAITDTARTSIDGGNHFILPIVSGAALSATTDALLISSDDNALSGLTITGAPRDAIHITGNSNQIVGTTVLLNAGRHGLFIDGGRFNTLGPIFIGTRSFPPFDCSPGNAQGGLLLANGAMSNTIEVGEIACNSAYGVRFDGSGTAFNTLLLSNIGFQTGDGVQIVNGAHDNTIGGQTSMGNLISGNSQNGVYISGGATAHNHVDGNLIGLDASGDGPNPNGQYGVRIAISADHNHVGEALTTDNRNFISGNTLGGVSLESGAFQNSIQSNYIGLNRAGAAAIPNGGPGVSVDNADQNFIGSADISNEQYISGNQAEGVRISSSDGELVGAGNRIGVAGDGHSPLGNGASGILLSNTTNTPVFPTLANYNHGAGIAVVGSGSVHNRIIAAQFIGNLGLPIDLGLDGPTLNDPGDGDAGPDTLLNYPVVTAFSGSVVTGTACANCIIVIYDAVSNPAADGGGATPVGQNAGADGAGLWHISLHGGRTRLDVTFQACEPGCSSFSNTSELSPRPQVALPLVRR